MENTKSIDLDLVDQTIALIPEAAWSHVRQVIITTIVDNMPGAVVEKLTGTYDDFDRAEEILYSYYELPTKQQELIIDAFKIIGSTNTLELLDRSQLDQFIDNGIPESQGAEMSAVQER